MSRIDWIVLRRIGGRVGLTVAVLFGLLCLVESLDSSRFRLLSGIGGPLLAIAAIVVAAARNVVGTLPVTVLIGTIIGALDLQAHRELTVIKAAGISIWRIVRAPVAAALLLGLVVALVGDTLAIQFSRAMPANRTASDVWLEQRGPDGAFILHARRALDNGRLLEDVSVYGTSELPRTRIEAPAARLEPGAWVLDDAIRYRADAAPERLATLWLATTTTAGDMQVRLTSSRDLTFGELMALVGDGVADPALRAAALTSFVRLLALPVLLAGSVLMGFAFTSGYRRTNKYGGAVLYGVVLGFVVYVVTELAIRSGSAGALDPTFAAGGPAFVAVVIGLTVLLYREDGRA